ncbi:MAG: serine/threonine-protein kinase PknK [Coleofasciculus sp. G3-WIS-01]|uniref:ATP-binding protein n=1 Tax=Coleofasciculus sp. G3-WIS-01 TaxID=3069528 RepID=UPI003301EA3B
MIVQPDIKIVSKIYESDHSLIYRGIFNSNHQPVILKCLKTDYPTPLQLYRYQQEYTITRHLNLEGTLKAYNLINDQNTLILVVEDFGGESLKLWLKRRSFSIPEFLTLAIQITEKLGKIHQNQVIHKDINPAHIVWNPQTGQLKLIDFSIATQLCQENPHLKSPHSLDGTLAYISPEQTGRMNRVIDYRTDFYSLGVTFYEWLTHQLPFIAVDALELVHCLMAKQPIPPHKINPDIPLTVSDIIMKLMAKTPEARYQSAWGIKADLEICLRQWKNGAIEQFNLGYHDIADRLHIPQTLYGRKSPIQSLLTAFSRIASAPEKHQSLQPPELIIISGYAGIGKSVLVKELYPQITQKRGYLISGKFEQLHRDSPYQGLVAACQDLVQQLLTETQSQLHQWRQKNLAALGENGQVISDVIPDIELVIGKQPPVPELPPKEAQNRLNFLFQSFLQVFCKKEHPLVLFLDDLQWADTGTLQWLKQIMTQGNTHYLLLIATYRDNEVSPTHPVMLMVSQMKKQGVRINSISLSPLRLHQVNQWIADTLKSEGVYTQKLAELVWQKTRGNPFFIKAFLNSLYTNKLLTIDRTSGVWSWNLEQIRAQTITDNVVEFMTRKIQSLSEPTQTVLKLAACLGNPFDLATLSLIYQNSRQATANHLWHAIQTGLIIPTGQNYNGGKINYNPDKLTLTYKFAHDRIQQAAYSLILPEEKPKNHWKIGQILYQNTYPEIRKPTIFQIVNQLNLGITATASQNDRYQLAQLNLVAGKKAKVAAAYQPAWNYLNLGIRCLDTDSWLRQYDLTLALYVHAVEVAILSGNIQDMDNLAAIVLKQATSLLDKVKVYEVKIQAYTAQNQPLEAINTALAVLNLLGIRFPQPIKKFHIIRELLKTKLTLVGKSIAGLIDLPIMTDPNKRVFRT